MEEHGLESASFQVLGWQYEGEESTVLWQSHILKGDGKGDVSMVQGAVGACCGGLLLKHVQVCKVLC